MAPNRLSYSEMYMDEFLYPSEWTESWDTYVNHKSDIVDVIRHCMENYNSYIDTVRIQSIALSTNFFTATHLFEQLDD